MSWSRRGLFVPALASLAGACNLRPLHMGLEGERLHALMAAIEIDTPLTPVGQALRDELADALNPAGLTLEPRYRLHVTLERERTALAIQLDDRITRFDVSLAAFFRLARLSDDRTLYRSAVRRVTSYNVVREPFATLIAEQDADRQAAQAVAQQIRSLLALHFDDAGA
ncbi:MAG: hypothetical protein KDE35_17510 [Geminicoccaceae bacterium]|nr:hypothetical protein [Geminicoccaceae bacterium]